uniref:Uncharacterized protein n=1 Tax=viral metagenome TaxID=1070528 RepID=A0A6M3XZR7_9ZZZZ
MGIVMSVRIASENTPEQILGKHLKEGTGNLRGRKNASTFIGSTEKTNTMPWQRLVGL